MPIDPSIEKRIQEAEKRYTGINKTVRELQQAAYELLVDWFDQSIKTDGAKIQFTTTNLTNVQGVFGLLRKFGLRLKKTLLSAILEDADAIIGLNDGYFGEFANVTDIKEAARLETLLRWGYNAQTKEIIAGGYLDTIFANMNVAQRTASLINQAITMEMPLDQFRKAFRRIFVGNVGAGMLEDRFKTITFDLYQRLDRTANLIYANRLGLNNAVYSGTIKDNTRPFCRARVNRVFTREEIASWAKLDFQGKPVVYDPFVDCGGYNCRHHLSFVSDQIAKHLKANERPAE